MTKLLHIETSTDICSIALSINDKIVENKSVNDRNVHSEKLTIFIKEILTNANVPFNQLDAIAVSKGPGSFTGLRIGIAVAKGICYGLDIPLISVNTLHSFYYGLNDSEKAKDNLFCSLADARNNEVYYSVFDNELNELIETKVGVLESSTLEKFYSKSKLIFIGNDIDKWVEIFENEKNVVFKKNIFADAKNIFPIALKKYINKTFEDLNTFEPFYLKDFKVKKSLKLKKFLNK